MRNFKMKRTFRLSLTLSRRSFVGAAVAGVGLLALSPRLHASPTGEGPVHALAVESDALLVARQTLLRSDDGGASWASEPAPDGGRILALATHPDRPGRIIGGLATGGVAVSEDGGGSWETRNEGLPDGAVIAITVAAAQPDTLYSAILGDGLWRSEDAGGTWTFVMDRPWLAEAERDPMALASVDLATGMGGIWIYAGTEAGVTRVPDCFCRWQDVQPGDVWASHDAGVVWFRMGAAPATAVAVHPTDAEHIVAALEGGLMQSRDGGATWSALAAE